MFSWLQRFKNSLRFKLLAPLTAIVIVAFVALSFVIISVQKSQLAGLEDHVRLGLDEQRELTAADLQAMNTQVGDRMAEMTASTGRLLDKYTREALDAENWLEEPYVLHDIPKWVLDYVRSKNH